MALARALIAVSWLQYGDEALLQCAKAAADSSSLIEFTGTPVHRETTSSMSALVTTPMLAVSLMLNFSRTLRRFSRSSCFLVLIVLSFLEILAGNGAFHPRDDKFDSPLDIRHLGRQCGLAQFHSSARFVKEIDSLIRKETVRYVPVGEIHRRFDCFVRVIDHVELFITRFHALQDANRFVLAGGANLDSLKAPFKRAVFFDGLAILCRCGGSNTLNFSARECRLQNVCSVKRTFGGSCANQGMQFVDEDDGIRIIHELLHDGFKALFELATILGTCHNQGQVQYQNPLFCQK